MGFAEGEVKLVALLNLSVLGFSFVDAFHDIAKRNQQGNLLGEVATWHACVVGGGLPIESCLTVC